jgi:anti-sigma regulatory factor (Ser/Thr protein kinase)
VIARSPAPLDLRATLPATQDAVEAFATTFRRQIGPLATPAEAFQSELLLRETLCNAVCHGARENSGLPVRCLVRLKGRSLVMLVDDRGKGFDWRRARNFRSTDQDCSGRGLEILRHYATRLRFNRAGNRVVLVKQLS